MFRAFAISAVMVLCLAPLAISRAAFAGEIPQAVKDACSDDYKQHCSAHVPESDGARDCMADVFAKLSDGCVGAILDSHLADEQAAPVETKTIDAAAARPARKHATTRKTRRHKRIANSHRKRAAPQRRVTRGQRFVRHVKRRVRIARARVRRALARVFH